MMTAKRLLALAALPAMFAFGQGGPGRMMGGGQNADPAAAMERRIEFLTSALSLTDAQKSTATKLFTDAHAAVQTATTNNSANRTALQEAVKKNDLASIERLSAALGTAQGQVLSIESKAQAAFYAILTPEQQTKYDTMRGGGRGNGMGGRPAHANSVKSFPPNNAPDIRVSGAFLHTAPMEIKQLTVGINTTKLAECRDYWSRHLGFTVDYEGEWYIQMMSPSKNFMVAFLQPEHPSQPPIFTPRFDGNGLWLALEVPDVDATYAELKDAVAVEVPIKDEPWGERHFSFRDPAGVAINLMTMVKHPEPAATF